MPEDLRFCDFALAGFSFFSRTWPNSSANFSFLILGAFSFLGRLFFFCGCLSALSGSFVSEIPTIRLFFRYTKKLITKEERLSPSIPITAKRARGRTVTQATIIFVVRVKGSLKMGSPTPRVIMAASIAFLIFTVPPNSVPLSIKLGGIIYRSFSSCFMDMDCFHLLVQ